MTKTYRELMMEDESNLSWCKPLSFLGGRVILAVNEGRIVSAQVDGEDRDDLVDDLEALARLVNDEYDDYQGWDDRQIIFFADHEELGCRSCPWFGICEAMDEEIEVDEEEEDEE